MWLASWLSRAWGQLVLRIRFTPRSRGLSCTFLAEHDARFWCCIINRAGGKNEHLKLFVPDQL